MAQRVSLCSITQVARAASASELARQVLGFVLQPCLDAGVRVGLENLEEQFRGIFMDRVR